MDQKEIIAQANAGAAVIELPWEHRTQAPDLPGYTVVSAKELSRVVYVRCDPRCNTCSGSGQYAIRIASARGYERHEMTCNCVVNPARAYLYPPLVEKTPQPTEAVQPRVLTATEKELANLERRVERARERLTAANADLQQKQADIDAQVHELSRSAQAWMRRSERAKARTTELEVQLASLKISLEETQRSHAATRETALASSEIAAARQAQAEQVSRAWRQEEIALRKRLRIDKHARIVNRCETKIAALRQRLARNASRREDPTHAETR